MVLSAAAEDRYPWLMDSCHTIVRSHCCDVLKSTAWLSVLCKYAGSASASWFWSLASHSVEQPTRALFQSPTKVSSKGL
jgi:hypothetical protein